MNTYNPDAWVLLKFTQGDTAPVYKVLAGWYGGYLNGDSWRVCSGVEKVEVVDSVYHVYNYSGSVYHCEPGVERFTGMMSSVYCGWEDQISKVPDMKVTMEIIKMKDYCAQTC